MTKKYFYVYKWFVKDTNEVFYIGKGCRNRHNNISERNQIFKDYYENYDCQNEIIEYFDMEQDAFDKEKELIAYYRNLGQAQANIDDGGRGGLSFIWTDKMREYKSKYNPMKDEKQKKRISENNPMKNPKIAQQVAEKTRRPVIINGITFSGVAVAARELNTANYVIESWCKRGYNTDGQPCRYADEKQKEYSDTIKVLGARAQSAKGVIIDGIYYPSVKKGAEAIKTWPETLIRAIKANRLCKGHTCSYANQQPNQENNQ